MTDEANSKEHDGSAPSLEKIKREIESILLREIEFAKPDEQLSFLESQVPRIACDIVRRFYLRDDLKQQDGNDVEANDIHQTHHPRDFYIQQRNN